MKMRLNRITNPQPEPTNIRNGTSRARSSIRASEQAKVNIVEARKSQTSTLKNFPKPRGLIPK